MACDVCGRCADPAHFPHDPDCTKGSGCDCTHVTCHDHDWDRREAELFDALTA